MSTNTIAGLFDNAFGAVDNEFILRRWSEICRIGIFRLGALLWVQQRRGDAWHWIQQPGMAASLLVCHNKMKISTDKLIVIDRHVILESSNETALCLARPWMEGHPSNCTASQHLSGLARDGSNRARVRAISFSGLSNSVPWKSLARSHNSYLW